MKEDRYFSKLDLTKGYQIRVRPADVHKTAFVTMGQHYEYLRMPFEMVNSGMTMTRAVRKLLDGIDNAVDYIDDLLVHTRTCADIEGTVQVIEGRQPCCKAYKVCYWSNTSGLFESLFGTGYDGVARCQCPEDEGRT